MFSGGKAPTFHQNPVSSTLSLKVANKTVTQDLYVIIAIKCLGLLGQELEMALNGISHEPKLNMGR